jgi:hypothetical protein
MALFPRDASRSEGPGFARRRAEYGPACKSKHNLPRLVWVGILILVREHTARSLGRIRSAASGQSRLL